NIWRGAASPKAPGSLVGVGPEGRNESRRSGNGTANRRKTKGGGKVRRESERLVVPVKRGNSPHEDPVEGRGRRVMESLGGNTVETPSSKIVCTKQQRIAELA